MADEKTVSRGLVIGKFYPLHKGHLALIDFALTQCDYLTILVCVKPWEDIGPLERLRWVQEMYLREPLIIPILNYDLRLPDNSGNPSSRQVSAEWANYIVTRYGTFDCVIGSEKYIEYMAEIMGAKPIIFDLDRTQTPISSTMIREDPQKYFDFIANVARSHYFSKDW